MLENVMAACHSILVPARILEHPNKVPAVHGGYNTYRYEHSQHYTRRFMTPNRLQIHSLGAWQTVLIEISD